jgi:hypothetical protein
MAGNPCIQCRVSREAKARLHAIAQDRGATESELLKKLVDVALLQSTGMRDLTVAEPVGAVSRNARVFVRLRPAPRMPRSLFGPIWGALRGFPTGSLPSSSEPSPS